MTKSGAYKNRIGIGMLVWTSWGLKIGAGGHVKYKKKHNSQSFMRNLLRKHSWVLPIFKLHPSLSPELTEDN